MVRFHPLFENPHLGLDIVDLLKCGKCGGVNSLTGSEINMLADEPKLKAVD
jgi:hypothetical protein